MSGPQGWACLHCGHSVWDVHSLNLKKCRLCPGGVCTEQDREEIRGLMYRAGSQLGED